MESQVLEPPQEAEREPPAGINFKLGEFEGPLDLLIFLVKKNEVNIYDIPIAQITEQYLDYVRFLAVLDLDDLTEFQTMAATLVYIKSRMLLPVEIDLDEIEDPRQELVEQLIEYQKFKKLSELMEEKGREAEWIIERKRLQQPLPFTDENLWQKIDVWDLLKTFSTLINSMGGDERIFDMYEEVSINEKTTLLSELLDKRGECSFADMIGKRGSIMDIVCAFLALLEAVKLRMVTIYQNRMFGDILIRGRKEES
ncbi:MAG: segregation/condensation protein A [Treponema sp.]|jgi:segregation and condensation protein A|nr:segregation/condensation protein A [Treponema sp.]